MKHCLLFAVAALLIPAVAGAQEISQDSKENERAASSGWYVGLQGGSPFAVSTFSAFGADKFRAGWSTGVYGGYRFNPIVSLELLLKWGNSYTGAQQCCIDKNYWLGEDFNRYYGPQDGMNGWSYSDLRSSSFMQSYGVQANVNILGFFKSTRDSRWLLELSPRLAAVGTKGTLYTISDNTLITKGDTKWHLGTGGNIQLGYRIADHFNIGIYSGLMYLTGRRLDNAPEFRHKNNFIWESGLRFGFSFGKCGKKSKSSASSATSTTPVAPVQPAAPAQPKKTVERACDICNYHWNEVIE